MTHEFLVPVAGREPPPSAPGSGLFSITKDILIFRTPAPRYLSHMAGQRDPDPMVICDKCKVSEADSEKFAVAEGWLVDYSVNPHTHVCPECLAAAA